jgi:hypothetical protein
LDFSAASADVLKRVENAVREVLLEGKGSRFPHMLRETVEQAREWEAAIKVLWWKHNMGKVPKLPQFSLPHLSLPLSIAARG